MWIENKPVTLHPPVGGTVTVVPSTGWSTPPGAVGIWPPLNAQGGHYVFVVKPRIANLHAGAAWMSDDFDAPLPEGFLISGT
jgi:hypothetical protein